MAELLFEMARKLPADDAACAHAVTVFRGDINTVNKRETLLGVVVFCNAPRTLAALGARGDVDPNRAYLGSNQEWNSPMCHLMCFHPATAVKAFLDAFPAFDVNVPCDRGRTPVQVLLMQCRWLDALESKATLTVLLDAGADCSRELFNEFCLQMHPQTLDVHAMQMHPDVVAFLPQVAWLEGERRVWMIACVALAVGAATVRSSALLHVLADTLRVCMPPTAGQPSHQLLSEYAGMVAAFL